MKIAIVAPSATPFMIGGAEKLWWGLLDALNASGEHAVELIKLPSPENDFWSLMQSYKLFSELNLDHFDRIITTKYPAWMVPHRHHIVYLQHRLRGLYDCYPSDLPLQPESLPSPLQNLCEWLESHPPHAIAARAHLPQLWQQLFALKKHPQFTQWQHHFALPGPFARKLVHHLDTLALNPEQIQAYFAISHTVARRPDYFPPEIQPKVMPHPSDVRITATNDYRPYIFTASRLDSPKRIDLIIKAYAQSNADIPLWIAGTGPQTATLQKLIDQHDLSDRITLLGYVANDQLITYYQQAQFVVFTPYDEDMGLITLEAMQAAKAVVTLNDTGGVKEFIQHQHNGWIANDLDQLTQAIGTLAANPEQCRQLGQQGHKDVQTITWQPLVKAFTRPQLQQTAKPRMLVVNTFNAYPPNTGGKARMYHLYNALSAYYNITMLVLDAHAQTPGTQTFNPSFKQIVIPTSQGFRHFVFDLEQRTQLSSFDLAAMLAPEKNPAFLKVLQAQYRHADFIVSAHCYAYPAIQYIQKQTQQAPTLIYDAHNIEWDLKTQMLQAVTDHATTRHGQLLQQLFQTEAQLTQNAQHIWACSSQDRQRLLNLYHPTGKTSVVPNGTNLDQPHVGQPRPALKHTLSGYRQTAIFIGSLHHPNILSLKAILNMAPHSPDTLFIVIGSVVKACQSTLNDPVPDNVWLVGEVSETEKTLLMNQCDLGLNPVTQGSGTNLKIFDYIKHRLLVLTTAMGNRGLIFENDKHLLIRSINDFPDTLNQLAHREFSAKDIDAMKQQSTRVLTEHYSWQTGAKKVYEDISTTKARFGTSSA
ncbi:MAG: glycosyltransferase [Hydrogenovibrio sp.]|uniref:glycosyltransferase family 4 protein n=1 Tax=Hydrogenovibrio sp. TaxID=2065821 RepID=UPI00286FC5A0|nr:glycosyltransferase [Hydrogenovibrio sp.]MDR9499707.1 glycosyltransferase [Hydrogenovibrio sp.]